MPQTYLDNASTSWPRPAGVGAAMAKAAENLGTPGRGTSARAREAGAIVSRLRAKLGSFIGVTNPDRVILTAGATDALSGAIMSVVDSFGATRGCGDARHVVTSAIEHNSVRRPLQFLAGHGTIRLTEVPADNRAVFNADAILNTVDDDTCLIAVTMVSNAIGSIQPIRELAIRLRERKTRPLLLVDACQGVGVLEILCEEWGIDLLAFSGHKALRGPQGVGAIYIGPRAYSPGEPSAGLRPWIFGGTGVDSQSPDMPLELPARFEAGTVNIPGFAGLLAALEYPDRESPAEALSRERRLCALLEGRIAQLPGVRVHGPSISDRVGMVAISIEGWDPQEIALALETGHGIIVRGGLQCAPGAHAAVGTLARGGTVRISPGPATTESEIEACAAAIKELSTG